MRYPNLEAERARVGISKGTLAVRLGVSRKTLYNWTERGTIPPEAVKKLCRLFSCSVDYLLQER